jgi:hypothetical protein
MLAESSVLDLIARGVFRSTPQDQLSRLSHLIHTITTLSFLKISGCRLEWRGQYGATDIQERLSWKTTPCDGRGMKLYPECQLETTEGRLRSLTVFCTVTHLYNIIGTVITAAVCFPRRTAFVSVVHVRSDIEPE